MAADTARLLAELSFSDKMSPGIKSATSSLDGLVKSTKLQQLEISKLGLAHEKAAALAQGALSKEQKAVFAQRKAIIDAGIAQEKYSAAIHKSAVNTVTAEEASGKYSGTLGKIRTKLDGIGQSKGAQAILQGVGIGAGINLYGALGSVIGRVTDFVEGSAEAFQQDQRSQAALRAALESNIPAWNGNADAIEKVLLEREKLGFSDDEQRDSLARLVGLTHDSTKALDLQREAMDLARLRGIDLASAGDIIGKVYGGNLGILSRYGIVIRKGATATEALAEIQKLAGGQAENYAETDLGKATAASIRMEEAQEKLGESLSKLETAVLPAVADAVTGVVDVVVALGANMDKLTPVAEALAAVLAIKVVGGFVQAGAAALGFGTDVAAGVGAASAASVEAEAAGTAVGAGFTRGLAGAAFAIPFLTQVQNWIKGLAPSGLQQFENSWGKTATAVVDDIKLIDRESLNARRSFSGYGESMKAAAALFAGGAEVITVAAKDASREVQARMRLAAIGITDFANQSDDATAAWRKHFRDDLFSGISAVRAARQGIDGQFAQLESDLKNFGSRTGREAHDVGQLASKELQKALHSGIPLIRQEAQGVQLAYLDELQGLVRDGDKIGKKGMDALRDAIHSKNPEVARVAAQVLATIEGQIDRPSVGRNAGAGIGQSIANSLAGKAGAAGRAAAHITALIRANLPTRISTTIDVMVHYHGTSGFAAEGGVFGARDTAIVGEEGKPEIVVGKPGGGFEVIPLDKLGASSPYVVPQVPSQTAPWTPRPYIAPMPERRSSPLPIVVAAVVTTRSVIDGLAKAKTYGSVGGVATPGLPTP